MATNAIPGVATAVAASVTPVLKEFESTTSFKVAKASIDKFAPTGSACVYGFQHCSYAQVAEGMKNAGVRVLDCGLGDERTEAQREDGSKMFKVVSGMHAAGVKVGKETRDCNRQCKSGLVNFVMEQVRKKRAGEATDKQIICIDKEGNPYPLTSENLLSKTKTIAVSAAHTLQMNNIVTHSELRRVYKLCNDPEVDPEVRAVAKEVITFVKVNEKRSVVLGTPEIRQLMRTVTDDNGDRVRKEVPVEVTPRETVVEYSLEETTAPWDAADFDTHWDKRKEGAPDKRPAKDHDWRKQVNLQMARMRVETAKSAMGAKIAQHKEETADRAEAARLRAETIATARTALETSVCASMRAAIAVESLASLATPIEVA